MLTDNEFAIFRNLIYQESGMVFKENKKEFLEYRIARRMKARAIADKDFTIVYANKPFAGYVGLPREEILGEKCYAFKRSGDRTAPGRRSACSRQGAAPAAARPRFRPQARPGNHHQRLPISIGFLADRIRFSRTTDISKFSRCS